MVDVRLVISCQRNVECPRSPDALHDVAVSSLTSQHCKELGEEGVQGRKSRTHTRDLTIHTLQTVVRQLTESEVAVLVTCLPLMLHEASSC